MNRTFLSLLFLSITALGLKAQKPDPVLVRVKYTLSHIRDTNYRSEPYKEEMLLVTGKNASIFTSYDNILQANRMAEFIKQQTKASGGVLNNIVMQKGLLKPVSKTDFYYFPIEKKAFIVENLASTFLIPGDTTPIHWKIAKDTLSFSGIHCQMATTVFKGRKWTAWFAPDLPFQSGPWKLNGLPGLIIEAYDERKDVTFRFAGMEKPEDANALNKRENLLIGTANIEVNHDQYLGKEIKLPKNTVNATAEEIKRYLAAKSTSPTSIINSQSPTGATVRRISSPTSATNVVKRVLNNPIELAN